MFSDIQAIIVDLDGTLVDTAPDFQVAINRMRAELDLACLDIDTIKRFVGQGTENLMRRVLAVDFSAPDVERYFQSALSSYMKHYLAINGNHSTLYPGVRAGLDAFHAQKIPLACVTNKPMALALPLLKKSGLAHYFDVIYGGDSLPRKKPDPLPFLKVCQDFSLSPGKVVAIGDSCNDVVAARAAGCPVLTVPYGYNHGKSIQNANPDGIVHTLFDAVHLIFG